jgi:predicted RNase H-like nuclease
MGQEQAPGEQVVAGVDGCRGGWIVVMAEPTAEDGLRLCRTAVVPDFAGVLALAEACAAVAVDMPIGLSADGRRQADFEARRRVGPRRSSVFPPPPRSILSLSDYVSANAACRARFGRGMQKQVFNIAPRMREVDLVMTPALQARYVEAHPEVCFWALGRECCLEHAKRTPEGRAQRLSLLTAAFGEAVGGLRPPAGAGWDDLYDACALAWTAARVAAGAAVHLPAEPERDERGLRMEIVY